MLGIELPRRAGIKFSSPFRPDKNPSCSVYQSRNELRFRDWSHGVDVDPIGFYALARGIPNAEAIRELRQRLGVRAKRKTLIPKIAESSAAGPDRPARMPDEVAEIWREGVEYLAANADWQRRIGQWRGWTPEVVAQLVDDGMMGTPAHRGRRLVAFRVDYPVVKDFGPYGTWFSTEQVGFHVRLKPERPGEKPPWRFYPNGREHGQRIPSLPFIIGEFPTARLLVITEGQWDAITFALAAGWLGHDGAWPDWICVIGIRGTNGINPFLNHYTAHWPRNAKCLLLPDNDYAGATWFKSCEGRPSFADRLINRCMEVHVETVCGAKDFNEGWKRGMIKASDIGREFIANGFTDKEEEFGSK
jgi:hypothetical protein